MQMLLMKILMIFEGKMKKLDLLVIIMHFLNVGEKKKKETEKKRQMICFVNCVL